VPPTLLYRPLTSEADVGGTAIEVKPSHQYSSTLCCHVTFGSRRAVWENSICHGSTDETRVCNWISLYGKNCTHWHSSVLYECLWKSNSGCEYSETVVGVFLRAVATMTASHLCWCWFLWVWYKGSCSLLAMTVEKWCFVAENFLYQIVLLNSSYLSQSIIQEINRRHYFWPDLCSLSSITSPWWILTHTTYDIF